GVDAKVGTGEDEDRIHVAKRVKGEIDARSDLESPEAIARRRRVPPHKVEARADLKEKKGDQERLHHLRSIDMTEDLHHRVIGARPISPVRWLAMWSARKIPMMASADRPWATRSAAGTGRTLPRAGALLSARKSATAASVQNVTQNQVSGTGSPNMASTTPMK